MRTWHSIRHSCLHASVAAVLIGCGSDFGGDLGLRPGSTIPDAGAGNRADVAAQPDTGAADGGAAVDVSTTPDASAPPDVSAPPPDVVSADGTSLPPDVSTPSDGSMPSDGPGLSDTSTQDNAVDIRADALVSRDTTVDIVDARVDTSVDGGGIDTREAGPTGPRCGDSHKDPGEECDDGNTDDFDDCSSICTDRRACICCVLVNASSLNRCQELTGEAEDGPKVGAPKKELCQQVYSCLLKSRCGGVEDNFLECYCGAGNVMGRSTCLSDPRGPCIAELEAGYEAAGSTWQERIPAINNRFQDTNFGGGVAGRWWNTERSSCAIDCGTPPVWQECMDPGPPDGGDAGGVSDANGDAAE